MRRSLVIVTALAVGLPAGSAHAFRVLEKIEGSVELALSELTLPGAANGHVQYRACAACSTVARAVDDETAYRLDGQPLGLVELLAAIQDIRKKPSVEHRATAVVIYDSSTKRVTRVLVHVGRAQ